MNNRPLEVGDMVVIRNRGKISEGLIAGVYKHRIAVRFNNKAGCQEYVISTMRNSANKDSDCNKVICIRKPRKGNAESRAIVAMLAIECRKALSVKKQDYESEFKRGARCKDKTSKLRLYEKAKSMLK